MTKRHLFLGIFGLLIILIGCGYFYLNQSHRNIQKEEVKYTVTSSELAESFRRSGPKTDIADQVIQTKGRITALDEKSVTLDKKVEVLFLKKLPAGLKKGKEVTIKGRCVGYDDLLEVVKVDQALLIEQF
ncbi:hypothetical protein [Pricia sp.]|uniref:hypothetical protein n=1 Tax=Pricia sp. TaxID=2268138 RepID=UPI0035935D70